MRLKLPEWLYLDPTKSKDTDHRDSWGYPKRKESDESQDSQDEEEVAECKRQFSIDTIRHAGSTAVSGIRETYQRLDAMPGRTMSGPLTRVILIEEMHVASKEDL